VGRDSVVVGHFWALGVSSFAYLVSLRGEENMPETLGRYIIHEKRSE